MKIAVTGASGYLGTGVVKQLCDDGNDVIAAEIFFCMIILLKN